MTSLTFKHAELQSLLQEAEARWPHGIRRRYHVCDPAGFWLVGDEGVYLLHNGVVGDQKASVVYAAECNPKIMCFDAWWNVKHATFGGDDGVDFIEADYIRNAVAAGSDLIIKMSPDSFEVIYTPRADKAGRQT
ncbi:DUF3085 domain-containing protein [Aminobacter sp. MET-1]|uniref:DUF3085 domain-containing protein n=1 Tax=Aminobacter sp. MET-1 TaxID=2951085 RepID=UPI00226A7871|nr:DUF3085 domain-containing protein [Aminobacter sp. MET-1]MCX8571170.1 DUF3085 domain-containing protein [Aminobacter sp. MET-1]MCX8573332.1 DUF3085 domain-containing protein [Aminobacter sp. MET-1]